MRGFRLASSRLFARFLVGHPHARVQAGERILEDDLHRAADVAQRGPIQVELTAAIQ
jgi:hypothetical protein